MLSFYRALGVKIRLADELDRVYKLHALLRTVGLHDLWCTIYGTFLALLYVYHADSKGVGLHLLLLLLLQQGTLVVVWLSGSALKKSFLLVVVNLSGEYARTQ